jgi:hypothetical protein
MVHRWTNRLFAVDVSLYTQCETVVHYAIMR